MLRDYDKGNRMSNEAILNYNEALEIFRREMGNSHNQYTAVALGNLGLVYREKATDLHRNEYS